MALWQQVVVKVRFWWRKTKHMAITRGINNEVFITMQYWWDNKIDLKILNNDNIFWCSRRQDSLRNNRAYNYFRLDQLLWPGTRKKFGVFYSTPSTQSTPKTVTAIFVYSPKYRFSMLKHKVELARLGIKHNSTNLEDSIKQVNWTYLPNFIDHRLLLL